MNLLEYFVHTEGVRRAQPSWRPRDLAPADAERLWTLLRRRARLGHRT